ncbi:MAG TPA: hypothetical protein VMB50_20855 [Myxococcales bacterium]|nr:hypothetical protein [Myxococcales bacterium]
MNDPTFDRLKRSFAAIIRAVFPAIDYWGEFPATVVSQNADGSLELQPDDRVRWPSLSKVPLKHTAPGVTITVAQGTRVRFGFDGGDPGSPRAALFDQSSSGLLTMLLAGGGQGAARNGDSVQVDLTLAKLSAFSFTAPSGGGACVVAGATQTLDGQITSGSSKVQIG